ncbi:MAG: phosphoribosylamine--glycine ligase [Verrucomicrobiia bacterium]
MNLFVVGGGGREHALAWKLSQEAAVRRVVCSPGNGGWADSLGVPFAEQDRLVTEARATGCDLVVVGPDDALACGLVDRLEDEGIAAFGPRKAAAVLEASKGFAKEFMQRHGIPTAKAEMFSDRAAASAYCRKIGFPVVIKANGLALGKGVVIAEDLYQAESTLDAMLVEGALGEAGRQVVIEEYLQGRECSVHALVSNGEWLLLEPAVDHKRVGEGDVGPNTGGMGTVSPPAFFHSRLREEVIEKVLKPFCKGVVSEGIDFRGLLFPGLILTRDGLRVLEFNVRFGDPETQVLMRRLKSSLLEMLQATREGALHEVTPVWDQRSAVCIIAASKGYPGSYPKGFPIFGLAEAEAAADVVVFHAGTQRRDHRTLVTSGGRVLGVSALGATITEARNKALRAMEQIHFEGKQFRRDIGFQADQCEHPDSPFHSFHS